MEHFYTYPTVTPLPRDRERRAARDLDSERRGARPGSDHPMSPRVWPERYASISSGGSDSTAS
jgi:hypothetical protein